MFAEEGKNCDKIVGKFKLSIHVLSYHRASRLMKVWKKALIPSYVGPVSISEEPYVYALVELKFCQAMHHHHLKCHGYACAAMSWYIVDMGCWHSLVAGS